MCSYRCCRTIRPKLNKKEEAAKAAYLINGETIHALFGINIQTGKTCEDLIEQKLRKIQEIFNGVRFVIIDEYSMPSQTMLSRIDFRLRQITTHRDKYLCNQSNIISK